LCLAAGTFVLLGFIWKYFVGNEVTYKLEEYTYLDPQTNQKKFFEGISQPPTKYLSVVVPAYKEEKRISVMLDETISYLTNREQEDSTFTWEIVVVDDGSTDKTSEVVMEYVKKLGTDKMRLNTLKKNVGKGGAVRRGMLCSRGKYLLMVDADGATKFSDLAKMEEKMLNVEKNGEGVIVGSRAQYHPEFLSESEKRPFYRDISHIVFLFLVNLLCVKGVKDTQCGFKLFTRKSAQSLFLSMHIERWAFDVDLLFLAQKKKYPIHEVIVDWKEIDGSHLNVIGASLQMFKDVLRVPTLYTIGYWKIAK